MYSQYSGTSFIHGAAAACARIHNSYALLWSSWDIDRAKYLVIKQLRVVLVRDEAQPPAASSAVAFCLCSFSRSLHVCIKSITERMHMYMLLTSINAPCMHMSSIAIHTFCVRLFTVLYHLRRCAVRTMNPNKFSPFLTQRAQSPIPEIW